MASPSRTAAGAALRRLTKKVWVRATFYVVIATVFALAAGIIGSLVPFRIVIDLGQDSVGSLLQIIATAMLTATTFSVTAMVTAYSSATTTATPRSTQLLIADPTSQNSLSVFIGAFVFSMVGIIALSTGYYTEQGRTILFFGTLTVIAVVVVTLMRWIAHLADFGRMADVIDRVEAAATRSLCAYAGAPTLGANRLRTVPPHAQPIFTEKTGFVVSVDVAALDRAAQEHDVEVFVQATAGRTADALHPLLSVTGGGRTIDEAPFRSAFRIAPHRDYEQDPRLGVIALAEIGSRALSPATNDPGTAIEVIAALQRVFTQALEAEPETEVRFPRVWLLPPQIDALVTDAFRPLARDGAGMVEVQIRLQKCLASLSSTAPEHHATFARSARDARRRARTSLDRTDFGDLQKAVRKAWTEPVPRWAD